MMDAVSIQPISHPVYKTVNVPGSKSLTNRALLIAALANGRTTLKNALFSDDSRYFSNALRMLGFEIFEDLSANEMTVQGLSGQIPSKGEELFIGNAGTAARFLTALLTLGNGVYILDGDARMRERPLGGLVFALNRLGAKVEPILTDKVANGSDVCPPIKIHSNGLPGGETSVRGDISSQYLSALLMAAPYSQAGVKITVTSELSSKPYIDMTIKVMSDFGVNVSRSGYRNFYVGPGLYQSIDSYIIEPDASAASYFFAIPAMLGGTVRIEDLPRSSKQGDLSFVDVLKKMGCSVNLTEAYTEVSGLGDDKKLRGVDVNMADIPDTALTLAAIAPFCSSPTVIRGIASARVKESDRVHAACVELTRLGVRVEERPDGMVIFPCGNITPTSIRTYNDHRMAMSFALIGLRVPGIRIENPGCVSKTFPEFFNVLDGLR